MKVLQEITVPQESVNDQSLIVLELFCKDGDKVAKGKIIAELETSKTAIAVESEVDGYIQYYCQVEEELEVNAVIARITDEPPDLTIEKLTHPPKANKEIKPKLKGTPVEETIFSTRALEMMKAASIGKEVFYGKDFVTEADVKMLLGNRGAVKKRTVRRESNAVAPIVDDTGKVEVKKIKSFKSREIKSLTTVQSAGLVSIINAVIETAGVTSYLNNHLRYFKNSLLTVAAYECSRLLVKYPMFNAYFNEDAVAFYKEVHIGFAIDIEKGLKVLKLKNTALLSLHEIEEMMFQLSNDYLDEKVKPEDLSDITFTITDLSGLNVFSFTPLINFKNSAILGISSIDGILNRCILSLAFDHRVTEGRQAAIFLSELKTRIESYRSPTFEKDLQAKRMALVTCFKCQKKLREDITDVGFTKCVTPMGEEGYICQSCLKGF